MAEENKPAEDRAKSLLDRLWADGDLGPSVRRKAKEMFPDISLPEDTAEPIVAPVKAEVEALKTKLSDALERISKREQADEAVKTEAELSKKLSNARSAYNLTDSGFEKMVARMKETGNYSDADAAAAWVVAQTPKPKPSDSPSWLPKSSNLFGSQKKDEQWESLHKDPLKYMDDQLRQFASDPDGYVAETFGNA